MKDQRLAAHEALVAARQAHEVATRALQEARRAASSHAGVPVMTQALERARASLQDARTSVREATQALEAALRTLTEEQVRFERAETELRLARAIAAEPSAMKLVTEGFTRAQADLQAARLALDAAERRIVKEPAND